MSEARNNGDGRVAVLVDCDNTSPEILEFALRVVAQFGRVRLGALGQYLRRPDPAFSPKAYGHSGLLDMVQSYTGLATIKDGGGYWVSLKRRPDPV